MHFFGFWSSFYQLLDPDPDPGDKSNADPCRYGSGSETLGSALLYVSTKKKKNQMVTLGGLI
jgi:hypothetical protein